MPSYEYDCLECRKRFEVVMTYAEYGIKPVICPRCETPNVRRHIGRVRVARSDAARMESMADPTMLDSIDEDPRALGRMMRDMSRETGQEMGAEFNEVIHRLEAGQHPDQIERDMPDLAASAGEDLGE